MSIRRGVTLSDQVYAFIRKNIVLGVYESGQILVESELASELQVSRTPVSNAVVMLKERGLLEDRAGKPEVPRLSLKDVTDLYRCRLALDALATRMAAETMTPKDLVRLARDLEDWHEPSTEGDRTALWVTDLGFHATIYRASGNRHLLRFAQITTELAAVYRHRTVRKLVADGAGPLRNKDDIRQEHLQILDALREHDPVAAERAARRHIENVIEHLHRSEVTSSEDHRTYAAENA